MITMGGFSLPSRTIREMICASVDVVIQAARLRDGSRKITHITEVMGMEGDTIITQDLFLYDMIGEDAPTATSSAGIARPASGGRGSGIAPAITARRKNLARASRGGITPMPSRPDSGQRRHATASPVFWWRRCPAASPGFSSTRSLSSGRKAGGAASMAKTEPVAAQHARRPEIAPRHGRGKRSGKRAAPPERKSVFHCRPGIVQSGLVLVEAAILHLNGRHRRRR